MGGKDGSSFRGVDQLTETIWEVREGHVYFCAFHGTFIRKNSFRIVVLARAL